MGLVEVCATTANAMLLQVLNAKLEKVPNSLRLRGRSRLRNFAWIAQYSPRRVWAAILATVQLIELHRIPPGKPNCKIIQLTIVSHEYLRGTAVLDFGRPRVVGRLVDKHNVAIHGDRVISRQSARIREKRKS